MTTEVPFDLATWTATRLAWLERTFQTHLPEPAPGDDPGRLIEAMRYSLLAPGKRLRPLLALAAAEAIGAVAAGEKGSATTSRDTPALRPLPGTDAPLLIAAASIELVHCYSLIHDDLPAMDDDDWRRGKPSNHKVFGEAIAILAGDALLTLAFEWLAQAGEQSGRPADFGRAIAALARGAGWQGMVRGQARDLGEPAPAAFAELERLHAEKTAALFRAATEIGAAAAGGTAAQIAALGAFGHSYGIAFQHADDREDGDHPGHASRAAERGQALLAEAVQALSGLAPTRAPTQALRAICQQLSRRMAGAPSEM